MAEAQEFEPDVKVRTREFAVGCVGAGMIMAECHLAAYKEAGFPVVAIASRTKANAEKVADRWDIPTVHDTPEALIEDSEVQIIDLAYPPDLQPALIRHALKQPHIEAILAQKPLALSLDEARALRDEAKQAGKILSVLEDVWSGPRQAGYKDDQHITWRVEGTLGTAKGTIGWPTGAASTLTYASAETTGGEWVSPGWDTMWFPHAFIGVMEQLQHAVATGTEPALDVADNVKTMALVEAGYRSIAEGRTVRLSEVPIH